jgi:hypothetical protein
MSDFNQNKYCSKDCQDLNSPIGICDHCKFYDFNGDEDGAYTGDGYCRLHDMPSDPHDGCEDFVCFRVDGGVSN